MISIVYMSEVEPEITSTIEADEPVNGLPPIELGCILPGC